MVIGLAALSLLTFFVADPDEIQDLLEMIPELLHPILEYV
jgi:hypothetical protein